MINKQQHFCIFRNQSFLINSLKKTDWIEQTYLIKKKNCRGDQCDLSNLI